MEKIYDLKVSAQKIRQLDLSRLLNEEKLLHLHPHWFVGDCQMQERGLFTSLRDYETENEFELGLQLNFTPAQMIDPHKQPVMSISLFEYGVNELLFFSENDTMKVKVRGEGDVLDGETEHSMYLWIRAIQEYIRLYTSNRFSTLFFRMIMNKMILNMNPSQRKISIMITKITLVEILVIIVIVVGYVFFVQ